MNYSHPVIETLLQRYQTIIGKDCDKYRNHLYRVFLNCLLLDDDHGNEEKYAIAAVFHDIGIWTRHTIDYLQPSIWECRKYLDQTGKETWTDELTGMIYWHHKTGRYRGDHERTIETFRKADWIDVSLGLLSYGADKQKIRLNRKYFPNRGFHFFLIKKIGRNFFRHPLKPLPMFKR